MPRRAGVPCKWFGCPKIVPSGYCEEHKEKGNRQDDAYRPQSQDRGYDAKWKRYRKRYLREHPLCVECGRAAVTVDHIIPVTGPDDPLFWPETNHQSLCIADHNRKTVRESRL